MEDPFPWDSSKSGSLPGPDEHGESWGEGDVGINVRWPRWELKADEVWDAEALPCHHYEAVGQAKVKPGRPDL